MAAYMRAGQFVPLVFGIGVLLLGVLLVHTNGYLGSTYLPSLVGIQPCPAASTNSTPCTSLLGGFGGYGVGTIVCLFGLGLLTTGLRSMMARSSSVGSLPPSAIAALGGMPGALPVAGAAPGIVYCSKCATPNPSSAKFCHQCAAPMAPLPPPAPPPTVP